MASGRPKRRAAQPPAVAPDIEGRDAATGSRHCCGVAQAHPESARQCGDAAPDHSYDCGNRRARLGSRTLTSVLGWASFYPRYPAHRPVRGPCSTPPGRRKFAEPFAGHFRGLFTRITFFHPPGPSLADALLPSDSAPKFACAREGR